MSINQHTVKADPALEGILSKEMDYQKKTSFQFNQVKIPKGHSWLLRYLPYPVDPETGMPFLRIARHWVNKKVYNCPRHSSESIGGDIEAPCACCDSADRYANSANETLKKEARMAQGTPRYLAFCLVLARQDERGNQDDVTGSELWTPYEHWIPKGAFKDWFAMFRKGLKKSKWSITDWVEGNDIWVTSDRQNRLTWDKEDTAAIVDPDDEAKFKKTTKRVFAAIKLPTFEMPKRSVLEQLGEKVEDMLSEMNTGKGSRRNNDEEDEEADEKPKRRSRGSLPDDDEDEKPKKRASADDDEEDAAPKRKARPAADEDEDEKPKKKKSTYVEDSDGDEEDEEADEKPKKKSKPAADEDDDLDYSHPDKDKKKKSKPADEDEADEEDEDEDEADEDPKPKKTKLPPPPGRGGDVDEDDDVADEKEDAAPAKKTDVEDDDEDEGEKPKKRKSAPADADDDTDDEEDEDKPPKVGAKGDEDEDDDEEPSDLDASVRKRVGKLKR
jgi:hypothetical protein